MILPNDGTPCKECMTGIIKTEEITRSNGTKHNEVHCDNCGKKYGYRRMEAELIMPFGKHKGKTIEELYGDHNGKQYLEWFIKQDSKFARRVKEYLEEY